MCGRYTREYTWREVHDFLDLRFPDEAEQLQLSYNVAPTQPSAIARVGADGNREIAIARWGLIPSWADDPAIGSRLINARADGVATKPSFRSAFKRSRCLVPISGFYDWQAVEGSKTKQPWYFHPANSSIMCLAGLWERWEKGDEPIESFTIITTEANAAMRPVHDRMPVILLGASCDSWLDPKAAPEALQQLLVPAAKSELKARRVSTKVNSPKNDGPSLVEGQDNSGN